MRIILALAFALLSSQALAQQRVWVSEFVSVRVEAAAPMAGLPSKVDQPAIDISGGIVKRSAIFNSATTYIRVVCEVQCAISSGTATTSSILLPALRPEYFRVLGGSSLTVIAAP